MTAAGGQGEGGPTLVRFFTSGAGPRLLLAGAVVLIAVGTLAALTEGAAGVMGALVGLVLTLGVFGFGMSLTAAVARLSPALSLLVALLTYALQLLVLLMALVALERSDLLEGTLDREWLGGSVIAATVVWTALLALYHTRSVARDSAQRQDVSGPAGGQTSG